MAGGLTVLPYYHSRARRDPLVGPIFEREVRDWEAHFRTNEGFLVVRDANERSLP